jgi:hypothetical protein
VVRAVDSIGWRWELCGSESYWHGWKVAEPFLLLDLAMRPSQPPDQNRPAPLGGMKKERFPETHDASQLEAEIAKDVFETPEAYLDGLRVDQSGE